MECTISKRELGTECCEYSEPQREKKPLDPVVISAVAEISGPSHVALTLLLGKPRWPVCITGGRLARAGFVPRSQPCADG